MFNNIKKMNPIKQALFTLLIGASVVSFWRGVWGLLDVYLLPENYLVSSWISLIIGLFILAITHYWSKELV